MNLVSSLGHPIKKTGNKQAIYGEIPIIFHHSCMHNEKTIMCYQLTHAGVLGGSSIGDIS